MNTNYNDATLDVRKMLVKAGYNVKCYSEYHTVVRDGTGHYWDLSDDLCGKLEVQTSMGAVEFVTLLEFVDNCIAVKKTHADEDGVGRSWCDACGTTVDKNARYCQHCGAKFVG